MSRKGLLWLLVGLAALGLLACRATPQAPVAATPPLATPTPWVIVVTPTSVATPTPHIVVATLTPPAGSSDLQALIAYANQMKPILNEAKVIVERDGEIVKASEGGNEAVLCDGRLAEDAVRMGALVGRMEGIRPPYDAVSIHRLIRESGTAWVEALDNIGRFCRTGNKLYGVPAVLKFWEAGAKFQDAAQRFQWLLVAKGIEELVGP
ncbi:MAG: hypothetical protein ACE5MB_02210 [Anaerolineae bacterium]